MGVSATPDGTKTDERSRGRKVRKGTLLGDKTPIIGVAVVFSLLLIAKIVISGLYLNTSVFRIATMNLALAEEKVKDKPAEKKTETLSVKEQKLKRKELLLKKLEDELIPMQKTLEERAAQLNELQDRLTAFAKELAEKERALKDAKIRHLVALYSAMDPAKAAAIMAKLKIKTVVRILSNMKGKSAGKILAMTSPERGAAISEKLSHLD